MMDRKECDTEHLRDYPDCYEECEHDKCVGKQMTMDKQPTEAPIKGLGMECPNCSKRAKRDGALCSCGYHFGLYPQPNLDEQVEEFWKHFGFSYERRKHKNGYHHIWIYPNGREQMTYPPIDLNNLFKYAVPKLQDKDLDIYLFSDDGYYFAYMVTNDLEHKRCFDSIVGTEDPALALFWAIWEVIHD